MLAIETGRMTGPMAEFVEGRPVPVDRLVISLRRRHLHEMAGRAIERPRTADAEICAGRCDQPLGLRFDHAGWGRRRGLRDLYRETVALVGIEDSEAFEERDRKDILAGLDRALLL